MISCLIKISGRVQGVGFRYYTRQIANSLKIKGWVKNCYNGNVECLATADEAIINEFIQILKKGPALAKVDNILVSKLNEIKNYESFSIKY